MKEIKIKIFYMDDDEKTKEIEFNFDPNSFKMIQERPAKPTWDLFDDPWGPPTGWEIGLHSIKISG